MELSCGSRLHGVINPETGLLETKCRSKACGAGKGVVVLHYFSLETGDLIRTEKFRNPSDLFHEEEGTR